MLPPGGFANGMFDGHGVWTTALGDRFEGRFRAGQFHGGWHPHVSTPRTRARTIPVPRAHSTAGHGLYQYRGGGSYDGQWHRGMRHGVGTRTYCSGATYVGASEASTPSLPPPLTERLAQVSGCTTRSAGRAR